ncbi:DUF4198 domain-containing protein [Aquimarina algiphila]|uniref:DUF4198 domain-containing protein n=1 Tax=Aquimarina algiphila TaxID=2047982 RepID=UPI00249209FF|nr:DUF4198 domain-containing protein [Aquimarina algiphila]
MKRTLKIALLLLLISTKSFAHFFWIETNTKGTINKEHEVRIYFGEFGSNVVEKTNGEVFQDAKHFIVWVIDQKGNKTELKTTATESYYTGKFIPKLEGTYSIILDNKKYKVLDYTKYDYGIFRPQYHSITKVEIGNNIQHKTAAVNPESITIIDLSSEKEKVKIQVLFKEQPLAEAEVTVFMKDNWSKKINTDKNGMIVFNLPFKTRYVIEATHEDKVPGSYNGLKYQFTWHCAVLTVNESF